MKPSERLKWPTSAHLLFSQLSVFLLSGRTKRAPVLTPRSFLNNYTTHLLWRFQMATGDLLTNLRLYIGYDAHALICFRDQCQCALSIAGSRVTTHLRDKHHVPEDARRGLTKTLKSIPGLWNPDGNYPSARRRIRRAQASTNPRWFRLRSMQFRNIRAFKTSALRKDGTGIG